MHFSGRLDWSAESNAITRLRSARNPDYDLTESNPTQAGFDYAPELVTALADPRAVRYEPDARGLAEIRQCLGADLLTASSSESYALLLKLLCDPGDEILVPRPSYPLFEYLARLDNVRVRQYPLFYDHGWHIDTGALRNAVQPRTRAIVVVNPNNPTGSFLKHAELDILDEIGVPVISDEVFADYPLRSDPERITCSLGGLSKSAGLPQMKLGWIRAGGGPEMREEALRRLELIADTYLSVSTPVQWAALQPRFRAGVRAQIQERIAANLALVPESLPVEGGWYAILRLPAVRSEEEWVLHLLEQYGVFVQPGYFFDFETTGPHIVVSLITPQDAFQEGIRRVRAASAVSHS
jgi:alanine-synthesizing transaminase